MHHLSKRFNTLCRKRFGRSGWGKLGVGWADVPWRGSTREYGGGTFLKTSCASGKNPLRRKPCACQLGNWAKQYCCRQPCGQQCQGGAVSGLTPAAATTVPFPHWRFFTRTISANLAAGGPQLQWLGWGPGAGRGGAPHPTRGFGPADPQKNKGGLGLSQPHVAWGRLGRNPVCKNHC